MCMLQSGRRVKNLLDYCFPLQVAGGIPGGAGVLETLVRECEEEASIAPELARSAKAVGTIRYISIQLDIE